LFVRKSLDSRPCSFSIRNTQVSVVISMSRMFSCITRMSRFLKTLKSTRLWTEPDPWVVGKPTLASYWEIGCVSDFNGAVIEDGWWWHDFIVDVEGFGQTGPYKKRGGFDTIAIAIGGLLNITGPEVSPSEQYMTSACLLLRHSRTVEFHCFISGGGVNSWGPWSRDMCQRVPLWLVSQEFAAKL